MPKKKRLGLPSSRALNLPRNISSLLRSLKEKKSSSTPLLKHGNKIAKNHSDNLDILREVHFRDSTTTFDINPGNDTLAPTCLPSSLDHFLTLDLLEKAIKELPMGKAPGPDGIKNEILIRLPLEYKLALLTQFRASISMGFLPTAWLAIETIFIEKVGKPDKESPKTYRPIGLSSSILKLCEKLINWRIKTTVLKDGIPRQHAFTLNRSTETAISELVNLLREGQVQPTACNGSQHRYRGSL